LQAEVDHHVAIIDYGGRVVAQVDASYDLAILFGGDGGDGATHTTSSSVKHDF
jgi:hypothetical protein